MFVTALSNLSSANVFTYTSSAYEDVAIDTWYGRAIAWAADIGITEIGDGLFRPDENISREEIALIIYRYIQWAEKAESSFNYGEAYADDAQISLQSREGVYAMRAFGIMRGDNQNRFNPRASATRAEAAQLFSNLLQISSQETDSRYFCVLSLATAPALADSTFNDVPTNADYAHAVNALAERGIFRGDASGNFNPNNSMTRAEAATLLVRLFVENEMEAQLTSNFTDVPLTHWASSYIQTAFANGLISGYGDGRFGPNDAMTYNQALALLLRALNYGGMANAWGGWPEGYIGAADILGMTDGTTSTGNAPVPRSTVALLIYNALNVTPFEGEYVGDDYYDPNEIRPEHMG